MLVDTTVSSREALPGDFVSRGGNPFEISAEGRQLAYLGHDARHLAISWFMTGKIAVAGSIAGLEIVTKIAWYYLHERIWAVIPWGRRHFNRIA